MTDVYFVTTPTVKYASFPTSPSCSKIQLGDNGSGLPVYLERLIRYAVAFQQRAKNAHWAGAIAPSELVQEPSRQCWMP
jgi:hypothetical protein